MWLAGSWPRWAGARSQHWHLPRPFTLTIFRTSHAIPKREPVLFGRGVLVEGGAGGEAGADAGVDEREGEDGVGPAGDSGADLGEAGSGFVDRVWDAVAGEADGEGEAGEAAADEGEGGWGGG